MSEHASDRGAVAMAQLALDRDEIARLPQLYARGVDRRDWDLVRSCFSDDAEAFGAWSGPIAEYLIPLRAWAESYPPGGMHFVGNQLVEVGGDSGTVESSIVTVFWPHAGPVQHGQPLAVSGVRYHDEVVRTPVGWRITRRHVSLDWTRPQSGPSGIEDRHQIIDALNRLAAIMDHRQWDHLGEVMTPDVEAYGQQGLAAVVTNSLRRHLGGCGPSQHLLANYLIDVDGDTATSTTRLRVFHQGAGARSALSFECFGEYHDSWLRTDEGWRMSSRRLVLTMSLGDPDTLQPG